MSLPKVSVLYANGNLLAQIAVLDGIAGIVGTGYTPALLGTHLVMYSLAEAEELGITEDDEPSAHRHIKEFYAEVAGSQELHVMLVPETMTMAEMLDNTEEAGAKKLLADAEGKIRLLAVYRTPPDGYNGGTGMFDDDVADALITSKAFCQARLAELAPVRVLIEGRVQNFEVLAEGSLLITAAGTAGNTITLKVDKNDGLGLITLGAYTVQTSDTTALVATGLRAAMDALTGTTNFSSDGTGSTVGIVPPEGSGAAANDWTLSIVVTGTVNGTLTQLAGGSYYVTNTLTPSTSTNGFAQVLAGGTLSDGSASVGVALGRYVKYPAHIKAGKVKNGALSITDCFIGDEYIGSKDGERSISTARISALHGQGFLSFMKHPNKAGYYFGIDRMASVDDYRLMVYGRLVDKAAIIAAAVYIEELESEVEIDDDGKIDSLALVSLETAIKKQINLLMPGQISKLIVDIDPDQNLIESNTLTIQLRIKPLSYPSFINVDLGMAAPTAS